jgi:RNA polymerase sigma-70 factor (ECF subfamily)
MSSAVRTLFTVTASSAAPADAGERVNAAMDRYASGDDAAFADVYDALAPRLHAYLLRQTGDRTSADDLLQQTLLQMHRSRGTYIAGCAVTSWAFAIARRLCIDEWRRRKTDALWQARTVADDDRLTVNAPDEEAVSRQLAGRVEEELARLPETQRVAFELLRVEGLSHDEAAEVLGTTVSAVKLRAFRAYSAIRAVLGRAPVPTRSEEPRRKA